MAERNGDMTNNVIQFPIQQDNTGVPIRGLHILVDSLADAAEVMQKRNEKELALGFVKAGLLIKSLASLMAAKGMES